MKKLYAAKSVERPPAGAPASPPPARDPSRGPSLGGESRAEAVLREVQAVPAFPAVVNQILVLAQDPEARIRDIVQLAEHDPGLTSRVLQLANSAHFGGARSVGSLQDAIVRMGLSRFLEFVLACVVAPVASAAVRGYGLATGQLLEHSVVVGVGVEALAVEMNESAPRQAFTAGLLHDVGKIVLGAFVDVDVAPILEAAFRNGRSFEEAELQTLGISHPEVGALLLQHWNLPHELVEAVRFHHDPDAAPNRSLIVDLVHVADQLALKSGIGAGIDGLHYRSCSSAVSRTHLSAVAAERVLCRMVEGLKSFRELVQSSPGGKPNGA